MNNIGKIEKFLTLLECYSSGDTPSIYGHEVMAGVEEIRKLLNSIKNPGNEATCEVSEMPGTNGGFTMAVFHSEDVPIGTKLYKKPFLSHKMDLQDLWEEFEPWWNKTTWAPDTTATLKANMKISAWGTLIEFNDRSPEKKKEPWRKVRMANWPHSEHNMRLIGFVVPDDRTIPLGMVSERLEQIINGD